MKKSAWRFLWSAKDIRRKLLITLGILVLYRLVAQVPVPGVDRALVAEAFTNGTAGGNLLTLVDEILNPNRIAEEGLSAELEDYGAKIRVDLRNPINAVIGYAELLIENSEEMGWDYMVADLDRIQAAARRLLDLSTDIVEVATARDEDSSGPGRLVVASALTEGVLAKAGTGAGADHTDEVAGSLLVVDDNAMNRDLLSRQLARAGFMVQT
ncbi:MAG: hypothetical protein IH859_09620, partial [Chloroflexi bacterium]|nr:hypothetical protein [Chloroflexota bacterium]